MTIQEWIDNGCDYFQGVALYAALPRPNPILLKRFSQKQTSALLSKLKYELRKANKVPVIKKYKPPSPPLKKKEIVIVPEVITPKVSPTKLKLHDLPKELRPVLEEAHSLFLENCRIKLEINETPPEVNTYNLQVIIDHNWKRNQWCWNRIQFYLDNEYLAPEEPKKFSELTAVQLLKRQQSTWQKVSKAVKYIEITQEKANSTEIDLNKRQAFNAKVLQKQEQLINLEEETLLLAELIDGIKTNEKTL